MVQVVDSRELLPSRLVDAAVLLNLRDVAPLHDGGGLHLEGGGGSGALLGLQDLVADSEGLLVILRVQAEASRQDETGLFLLMLMQ